MKQTHALVTKGSFQAMYGGVHVFDSSTQEAEVGVQDQIRLQNQFQASKGYIVRPCLRKQTNKQTNKNQKQVYFVILESKLQGTIKESKEKKPANNPIFIHVFNPGT